ncbi:MAG: hypothetical protein QME78_13435 [Thermodesulfobacteriota bacterium]|nr:hypothetical protein [Thermodesulfobacteriota bacterium]
MNKKNKAAKKKMDRLSPQAETLLQETEDNAELWIKDADPLLQKLRSLSSDQQEVFLLSLLKKKNEQLPLLLEALCGKEEGLDLALAASLGQWRSPHAADILKRMAAAHPSKALFKTIRKSIFRLQSMGIPVKEISDSSKTVFHPTRLAPSEGFLSPIDPFGNRFIMLFKPQIPQGVALFNTLISDIDGIIGFKALETSRKNADEYLSAFQKEDSFKLVEADPDYCLGLITESYELCKKIGKTPPADFLQLRPLMGSSPPLPLRPLIYQHLIEEEIQSRPDLLERSASLFQAPFFKDWFLKKEESQKYLDLFKEANTSRLVLTPYQKEGRLLDIYRQAVHELFDESKRMLYRRRLEEMAYYLWKAGQENEARMSLAAALALQEESRLLSPNPFLLELVKRSLSDRMKEEEEEKKKKIEELIVNP